MDDGCIAYVRAGGVPLVPFVVASVRAIGIDGAAHHLEHQHPPDFLRMAFAYTWSPVDRSRLDQGAGRRIRGRGRRYSRVSASQAIHECGRLSSENTIT